MMRSSGIPMEPNIKQTPDRTMVGRILVIIGTVSGWGQANPG
jgi:hypothetical protein